MAVPACAPDADPPAAPLPGTPSLPASPPTTTGPAESAVDLDLPAGFAPLSVEFADARRGYALFVRCAAKPCEARLFGTEDAGRNWRQLRHPRPEAENHQLYVGAGLAVVLLAEPHAWYVSRDGATSWQSRPYDIRGEVPAEYHSASGRFYLDCPQDGTGDCLVRDWAAGPTWRRSVPPGLESIRSLTNGRDGRVWLAGVQDGRAVTAFGQLTGGFTRLPVPGQPGGTIGNARVVTSADGRDVWLVADQEAGSSGGQGGGRLPARAKARKGTGLPLLWQYQAGSGAGGSWVPRPITGITAERERPYAVAPAGGGLLVITGPGVSGYLDRGAYIPTPGTPALDWVGQLPDGTLVGRDDRPGVTYLSTGHGSRREWARVEVSG
ncbi:hypothetical protein GCM10022225_73330 [Plantactinospora mayteni]